MCARGRGRPPHGPGASPDSTAPSRRGVQDAGAQCGSWSPTPPSFASRLAGRCCLSPQASQRALSAKRWQHEIDPSRDKRFILGREENAQALPERTRAAPDATGASWPVAWRVQVGSPSPRWARWTESRAGHSAPRMRELARGRLCGRLGGAFLTGHGEGGRIPLCCEGPGPGLDQFRPLRGRPGRVAFTKSDTRAGRPPPPPLLGLPLGDGDGEGWGAAGGGPAGESL